MTDIYELEAMTPVGGIIRFSDFKGKTMLLVNTATKCGFSPHFRGLEALHQKYKEQGLVVIGFPCNQFGRQEPVTNELMEETCKVEFGVTFQLTEKIEVNGRNSHPVFRYLKDRLPGTFGKRIKWNFTKFLISPEGKPFKRYAPSTRPEKIESDILRLLGS